MVKHPLIRALFLGGIQHVRWGGQVEDRHQDTRSNRLLGGRPKIAGTKLASVSG